MPMIRDACTVFLIIGFVFYSDSESAPRLTEIVILMTVIMKEIFAIMDTNETLWIG